MSRLTLDNVEYGGLVFVLVVVVAALVAVGSARAVRPVRQIPYQIVWAAQADPVPTGADPQMFGVARTRVLRSVQRFAVTPDDPGQTLIYDGPGEQASDVLTEGVTYYYTMFSIDRARPGNWSLPTRFIVRGGKRATKEYTGSR